MELMTIKQYAQSQHISYEAVRKQVAAYKQDLQDHIIRKGRTQYLDEYAVEYLTKRRRESPIILMNMDQNEENQRLKEEIESLRVKLMTAQNELLKEKDRIISLQDEAKKTLDGDLSRQIEEKDGQIRTIQTEADGLRRQSEEDQKKIEDLSRERDEAQKEAQSFTRSIFGFYRKR